MKGQDSVTAVRVQCPVEESERQYNLRAAFPSFPETRETWVQASRELIQSVAPRVDLAYGDKPLQKLDYYAAKAGGPLLVFVHGGYWQGGDKADVGFMAGPYIAAGINVAVINYSLAPEARVEEMVDEVRSALVWLHAQADELNFNAQRISLMGHSAGGHLISMMVARVDTPAPEGMPAIVNLFPISGVFDVPPLLPSSINTALGLDQPRAEALSPLAWPGPSDTYIHTFVGSGETEQFHRQSEALGRAWKVARHDSVPGTDHFTVLNVLADASSEYTSAVIAVIKG
ncbi:alpha/beta hydrolase [Pusillimonas sp.]|uniref:alpha/beta hydrolase n=1 Tax=Pusillimonas sp. TaxID=3040095 RepID=UPI0037CC65D4